MVNIPDTPQFCLWEVKWSVYSKRLSVNIFLNSDERIWWYIWFEQQFTQKHLLWILFFTCLKQSQCFSPNDEEINTIAFAISIFQVTLYCFFFNSDVLLIVTKMDVLIIASVKPIFLTPNWRMPLLLLSLYLFSVKILKIYNYIVKK